MFYRLFIVCIMVFVIQLSYADNRKCYNSCECTVSSCTLCDSDLNTCVQSCNGRINLCNNQQYCCTTAGQYTCTQSVSCNGNTWADCQNANINTGQGIIYQNGSFAMCQNWANNACLTSCKDTSLIKSKAWFSITGRVVQCVKETLNLLFFSPECHSSANLLPALQSNLKNIIYIMMVLYVVLTGIRISISPQEFNKKEFFTFILKIVLVFYFSVGLDYKGQKYDGLVDIVYKGGLSGMESFSGFILDGAINNGLCEYSPEDYDPGFGYLAIWDSLDCRVAYYLGMGRLFIDLAQADKHLAESIGSDTSGGQAFGEGIAFGLVQIIIPLLFALEIVESLVIIFFGVLVLSLAVFFVHFYVVCMLGLTVTTYLGVIMVPLSLFGYTKQFFDSWVSVILSYIVQPCIIVAICALMMMAMDEVIYPGCTFQSIGSWGWEMQTPTPGGTCATSLGGQLYNELVNKPSSSVTQSWSLFFFSITVIGDGGFWTSSISAFLKLIFFSYLFLMFASGAGDLAAQLTGGPNIGELVKGAGDVFDSFLKKMSTRPGSGGKGGGGGKQGPSVSGKARQGINVKSK